MNISLPFVMVFFLTLLAVAQADDQERPCSRACPNGTVSVAVGLRDRPQDGDSTSTLALTSAFFADAKTKEDIGDIPEAGRLVSREIAEGLLNIDDTSDLRKRLTQVSNSTDSAGRCLRIKFLGAFTHGGLGEVDFRYDALKVRNVEGVLGGLDCAMADDARVFFGGCNVARGCRGDDLLMAVAGQLLKRGGGRVRGYTNYVLAVAGVTPRSIAPGNNTQFLTVGPKLSNPRWDDGNGDHRDNNKKDCGDRIRDAEERLSRMRVDLESCLTPNSWVSGRAQKTSVEVAKRGLERVELVMGSLEAARAAEAVRPADRTSFDPAQLAAGESFYSAFSDYFTVADKYGDISCRDCHGRCHQLEHRPAAEPHIEDKPLCTASFYSGTGNRCRDVERDAEAIERYLNSSK